MKSIIIIHKMLNILELLLQHQIMIDEEIRMYINKRIPENIAYVNEEKLLLKEKIKSDLEFLKGEV